MALIKIDDSILSIVEKYPETHDLFIANGFPQLADRKVLETAGRFLKLGTALDRKGVDRDTFIQLLEERIRDDMGKVDITLREETTGQGEFHVSGALPCPVRLPLLESFDREVQKFQSDTGQTVSYELEAASSGAGWMAEMIEKAETGSDLPDVFISAGFETFFDKDGFGRFREQGVFQDPLPMKMNSAFSGIDLADPRGCYGMIGVVPAVMMVNLNELNGLPMPRTWEDILEPQFEQRVSLPVGDFDLFNALLVSIYDRFGDSGVKAMGRSMLSAMHPAEMVKSGTVKNPEKPVVTIMPYFFTRMAERTKTMKAVWPEDGAIVSPIFMLAKKENAQALKPLLAFLKGKEVGEILSHRGLFPSTNPDVVNPLPESAPFNWIGWDWLESHDVAAVIGHATELFQQASSEVSV